MKERDTKANVSHLKNMRGTIKVLGQLSSYKVNVNELMGIKDDSEQEENYSEETDKLKVQYGDLMKFIRRKEKNFPRNRNCPLQPGVLRFDSKGRSIPFRDKSGCPIVDPSVLQVPEQITIDYSLYIRSQDEKLEPEAFIVSDKTYPAL